MSTAIFRALATRYKTPEWVIVPQVRDGTGFTSSRTADAVAMNCYPSKGLEVHGFEFKTARGDWLRELRDGDKAETVAMHCDRWWIVATKDVVKREELPKSWGLVTVDGESLRTVVHAPALPCTKDGAPLDRSYVASFLRGCLERAVKPGADELREAKEAGRDEIRKSIRAVETAEERRAEKTEGRWELAVKTFEAASGVSIGDWHAGRVGEEFAAFQKYRHDLDGRALRHHAQSIRELAAAMDILSAAKPYQREIR